MRRTNGHRIDLLSVLVAIVLLPGCEDNPQLSDEQPDPPAATGTLFNPATAGTIHGKVMWSGPIPPVAPLEVLANPLAGQVFQKKQIRPNPNAAAIDARTRGVGNAVVFLRGVDAAHGRPWNHPPVRLEQRDCQFHVRQGGSDSAAGFIRTGDPLEMVSQDRFFHSLHAGGAAFFNLVFPDPDQPLVRHVKNKGIVELTSAAGYYWMRAYLFVDDHPYYARTDPEGGFVLSDVPPGHYELVCWLPNWKRARHERDPESGHITRIFFEPPLERVHALTLKANQVLEMKFCLPD
jgi:hypothetical protein